MPRAIFAALALGLAACLVGCVQEESFARDDADGDTIGDADEGREGEVDTDEDGVPDYLDLDADDDGIADALEAGDGELATPPRDADRDGTPDFRDLDADDNGLPDAAEGALDHDGDGEPDFADLDDDNDLVRDVVELDGRLDPPRDADGDGRPDFRDVDSDDDLVLDGDEQGADTDRDGTPDREDLDSDDDGLLDREEAGDADVYSPPVDTDGDGVADFRDTDSDEDGLADAVERGLGTSPVEADTDRDGVTDLIEVAAGTDPSDPEVSPRTRGDFVFVVPFEGEPAPARDTLSFRTRIQLADLYFLFDRSGSMTGELDALVDAVDALVLDLTCGGSEAPCARDVECPVGEVCSAARGVCLDDPAASACLASPFTGVGDYEEELTNRLALQPDPAATARALGAGSTTGGTERLFAALEDLARGEAGPGAPVGCVPLGSGLVGCPGFREEAIRVVVAFTDEDSDGGALEATAAALRDAQIKLLGVWSGAADDLGRRDLVDLAEASGSVDAAGDPLVFDGVDGAVVPAVAAAIDALVDGAPLRVSLALEDLPDDAGDALAFVDHVEVNVGGGRCPAVAPLEDTDADGRPDTFPALRPGTPVCWDVVPRRNESVPETPAPQVFRARLTVLGDGSPLDAREVFFLVPPRVDPPGGPF